MKLLLTGAQGQVGYEIAQLAPTQGWQTLALNHASLDITDPQAVETCFARFQPDITINAAAYTAVDLAETNTNQAFKVNRDGAVNLATACLHNHSKLLHISTDYLFDGKKSTPYTETDTPNPQGVYGASKLAGEVGIQTTLPHHLIFRISWVFGAHGNNFLKTILRLAQERPTLSVVNDQYGGPTPALATAQMLLQAARQATEEQFEQWGVYHYCGTPPLSWHGFADFILTTARTIQPMATQELRPITTDQYPTKAQRPANSQLNCHKIQTQLGLQPPEWRTHAATLIQRMLS